MKLDFSNFHPLDHWPWECGDAPGGARRHIAMWWDYQMYPGLRRATTCRLGRHVMTDYWVGHPFDPHNRPPDGQSCVFCHEGDTGAVE